MTEQQSQPPQQQQPEVKLTARDRIVNEIYSGREIDRKTEVILLKVVYNKQG